MFSSSLYDPYATNDKMYELKLRVRIDSENDDGEEYSETMTVEVTYPYRGLVEFVPNDDVADIAYECANQIDAEVTRVFKGYVHEWEVERAEFA